MDRPAETSEPRDDEFCPQCGGGRIVGGYLGNPIFRWCRDCGATWRVSAKRS
jgi:uncharacterized protein (DUF983 family)